MLGVGGGCCSLSTFCLHITSQLLYVDQLFFGSHTHMTAEPKEMFGVDTR